jgi:hypothetical protein
MRILARHLPVEDDCEGAWWLVVQGVFAEPFRGVAAGVNCGDSVAGSSWSAMVHEGPVDVPKGDLSTCVLTKFTSERIDVLKTSDKADQLVSMLRSIGNMRKSVEMFALTIQLSLRQCGITVPIVMPDVDWAGMFPAAIPPLIDDVAERGNTYRSLVMGGNGGMCSVVMNMVDIMARKWFAARIPSCLMMIDVGTYQADGCPTQGQTNLGECLVSVHAGQVPVGMISDAVVGMAGMPFNIGYCLSELKFANRRDGYYAEVKPNTIVEVLPSGSRVFNPESGAGLLGHTIYLRRNANELDDNAYAVASSNARINPEGPLTVGVRVQHERIWRYAFAEDNAYAETNAIAHTAMELYADFDWLTSHDLTLILPSSQRGRGVAVSTDQKMKVAAYVLARILDSPIAGSGANIFISKFAKRRKLE